MNSTINKTFYTCSTESLFLRYKKVSRKAAKIVGFLQCSVHTFLGYGGWKMMTAGFFTFDRSWDLSKNLSYSSMPCSAYLSNKQQRSGRIIFKFHKRTDFFVFYDNQVLLGVISRCAPLPSPPYKKDLPLLFSLATKRIYLDTQLKGELTDLFWKLPGCSLFQQEE